MPDEARLVLAQLLQSHGRELAHDARRLRAMLADTLPGTADAKRLVAAAEEGIPAQLLAAGGDESGTIRLQLIRRLEEQRDMTAQAAAWTVDTWAQALEIPLRASIPPGPGDVTLPDSRRHEDDSLPPPPRRPLWIAGVIGAVLLGVVAVAALALLRPGDGGTGDATATPVPSASVEASDEPTIGPTDEPTPTAEPPPTAEPTPTPMTAAELELLSWVPSAVEDTCVVADHDDIGRARAQLDCDVKGMNGLTYVLYGSGSVMREQYARYVHGPNGTGSCMAGDLPSESTWHFEGGEDQGRYTCFRGDGRIWVVWTANYANILSWGYRLDSQADELWDAWANRAGPRSPG